MRRSAAGRLAYLLRTSCLPAGQRAFVKPALSHESLSPPAQPAARDAFGNDSASLRRWHEMQEAGSPATHSTRHAQLDVAQSGQDAQSPAASPARRATQEAESLAASSLQHAQFDAAPALPAGSSPATYSARQVQDSPAQPSRTARSLPSAEETREHLRCHAAASCSKPDGAAGAAGAAREGSKAVPTAAEAPALDWRDVVAALRAVPAGEATSGADVLTDTFGCAALYAVGLAKRSDKPRLRCGTAVPYSGQGMSGEGVALQRARLIRVVSFGA